MLRRVSVVQFLILIGVVYSQVLYALEQVQTTRLLKIDDDAFAGTSINVVAGTRQAIYTSGITQYAAYYGEDARLILARRELASDTWQLFPTELTTNVNDAHNTVSLVVDGEGYLHLAWGHHNTPLNYARSVEPDSLQLKKIANMDEVLEQSVSYPQFYALPGGDLLFAYRDGGSGRGNLVLKHYNTAEKRWSTRQRNLVDGENQRSAYWDLYLDANGVLHLAWNWRETPDVASNHDLYYARSRDMGRTWEDSDDKVRKPPFTQTKAERIARIPQKHNLMNPPAVAADRTSRPYVVSYWSAEEGKTPQFQVMKKQGETWVNLGGPHSTENFSLQGGGTRHPPISRAVLAVVSNWEASWPYLIYRDRAQNGAILVALFDNKSRDWSREILLDNDVGAWEPSMDPAQWQRMKQLHMLVQNVTQEDGNDESSQKQSSPIYSLIWSPEWEKLQENLFGTPHKMTEKEQQ